MRRRILQWTIAACIQTGIVSIAQAQMIDDVELRRDGNHAVVQLHFVAPVQFQRTVSVQSGDLVQVYYSILTSPATLNLVRSERRIDGIQGLPQMTITDEDDGPNPANRRFLVRFSEPTRQRIRGGRDRQSIEIILEGRGAALSAALSPAASPQAPPVADSGQRYAVSLQRSANPGQPLAASVPAEFQDNIVFTSKSVVAGKTVYEVILGYFATMPAAEDARSKLLRRFPAAEIVAMKPQAAAPAPAPVAPPTQAGRASAEPAKKPAVAVVLPALPSVPTPGIAAAAPVPPAPAAAVSTPPAPKSAPAIQAPLAVASEPTLPSPAATAEYNGKGATLLAGAEAAYGRGDYPAAIDTLNVLLNLPTNTSSRRAQ